MKLFGDMGEVKGVNIRDDCKCNGVCTDLPDLGLDSLKLLGVSLDG